MVLLTNVNETTAGLDVIQRPLLSSLLEQLNSKHDPFIVIELRSQDPLPEWTTHVAVIDGQQLKIMNRESYRTKHLELTPDSSASHHSKSDALTSPPGREIAELMNVRVDYQEQEVRDS